MFSRRTGFILLIACFNASVYPLEPPQGGRKSKAAQPAQESTSINVPDHAVDVVLCRPTNDSVTLSVLAYQDTKGLVAYGTKRGELVGRTPTYTMDKNEPAEIVMKSLQPDTQYYYQLRAEGVPHMEGTFHTQRTKGSSFTVTITADSHLDDSVHAELYQQTLANARADAPDFHIDLGDTFMTEKHANRANATRQYLAQRYYFGQLCSSVPLFLVLGNHDGESPRGRNAESNSLAVWSNLMRKRFFPNPVPDDFFRGNATPHPEAGLLQDYFAWEWGDALFIVLDPYWFTARQKGLAGSWKSTLGREQYDWLKQTLETSRSRYTFVFIHQLIGTASSQGRGGAEVAGLFEWGGQNLEGANEFADNRPGWSAPIHQLLVQHEVSAVFHGHDHLYVKQDLDGVVYQEVPQPGDRRGNTRTAAEYGYVNGVIFPSSGHLRLRISPETTTVEYVRACLPTDERPQQRNREVVHSYTIPAAEGSS